MIETLILNDMSYIKKDPMYMIVFVLQIIIGNVYRFLVMNIETIKPYSYIVKYLFILVVPMMVGMIFGLRFLDEKDEGIIPVYATSPLGIKAYIGYRIIQCVVLSLIELIILAGSGVVTNCNIIVTTIISILLAPLIFLVLGIMGRNKIQELTLLKLVGLVMMLTII